MNIIKAKQRMFINNKRYKMKLFKNKEMKNKKTSNDECYNSFLKLLF